MLAGGYFGGGAFALFVARRMQLMPGAPVTRFATDGPFALSRNPMYLGLALLYAGLCLMFGLVLTLALLVVPLAVIALVVIPFEEEEMAASFGDAYAPVPQAGQALAVVSANACAPTRRNGARKRRNRDRGPGSCT